MTLSEDFDRCTRCGLCEQACPTYRLLHFEPDSPRGRIFLMKEYQRGRAAMSEHLAEHLYRCLGCRACETVCPAGVPYGRLLEYGRHEVEAHLPDLPRRRGWRRFRALAFERVLPHRKLFHAVMAPARLLQSLPGANRLLDSLPLTARLRQLLRMIPQAFDGGAPLRAHYQAIGERRAHVGLFAGCVMSALFARTHAATARVLAINGCEVSVLAGQWCCGALNVHAGEKTLARQMARNNFAVFEKAGLDAIVVNSAGCSAVMKEYPELMRDTGDSARAQAFAAKTKDVTEFLYELGLRPGLGPVSKRVTYQDACHLAHGQGIRQQPRALLRCIPQLDYVELREADRCCGAAGVYSLTQPELASQILEEKLDAIVDSGAQIVATTNPGCYMQLQAGIAQRRLPVTVCHVMELLDKAYRSWTEKTEKPYSGTRA